MSPVAVVAPRNVGPWIVAGAAGGAIGGTLALGALLAARTFIGGAVLAPANAAGATLVRWLQIGELSAFTNFYPDASLGGWLLVMVAGGMIGAVFGPLVARFPNDHPVAWGLVAGFVAWGMSRWMVLPALDPAALRVLSGGELLAGHLIFGISMGLWVATLRPVLRPALR